MEANPENANVSRIIRNETYLGTQIRITAADRARIAAAVARGERERAARAARARLARLAIACLSIATAVAMFYAATN